MEPQDRTTPEDYKPLDLEDRAVISARLAADPPLCSELTFTNLFGWRHHYRPRWRIREDCLLLICRPESGPPFGLQPVGQGDRDTALEALFQDLAEISPRPRVDRADRRFVESLANPDKYILEPDRNNFDYVYLSRDLIDLAGRKYHRKRSHIKKTEQELDFEYRPLTPDLVEAVLDLQTDWCSLRECQAEPSLADEDRALYETMTHFSDLGGLRGGVILLEGQVAAFSLGEMLNPDTAVIHFEKADPAHGGLYPVINQRFTEQSFSHVRFVNREQDLGVEGLRKAKESYFPHHLEEKFTLSPKEG